MVFLYALQYTSLHISDEEPYHILVCNIRKKFFVDLFVVDFFHLKEPSVQ